VILLFFARPNEKGIGPMMTDDRLHAELTARLLALSRADVTEIKISYQWQQSTRWANNAITQNISRTNESTKVTVAFGQRVGSAATNRRDEEGLRQVVERAEAIARASEPDPEFMPPVEPTSYLPVKAFYPETLESTPRRRAEAISVAIGICRAEGLNSAGCFTVRHDITTIANSQGLFARHSSTVCNFTCSAIGDDSSGWSQAVANDIREINAEAVAAAAVRKALLGRKPVNIEPKEYTVILEPPAVAELLTFMVSSMDARAADEGRSAFTGKEGQCLAVPDVRLRSQPDFDRCPTRPFDDEGMPLARVEWLADGVLQTLAYSRYWAQRQNRPFTGMPSNLIMEGKEPVASEAMVRSTAEGLLVTRFWYVRFVDPMRLLLTGMTRDGLFIIRRGTIVAAAKNLRFNESPLSMLKNIEQVGLSQRCGESLHVPALKVHAFNFSSVTTF